MPSIPSHPVLSCADAKAHEGALLNDTADEWRAMQRAGEKLGRAIVADFQEIGGLPETARLLVLVGKGHNGGDALLAATEILRVHPRATVDILPAFDEDSVRTLTRRALLELREEHGLHVETISLAEAKREMASYDVCIDGIFGFQFRPPLGETTAELLAWINTHPRIRLRAAVDLPSGIGVANAETIFRADFTYATGIVKSPVLQPANERFVGRLRYLDLGFFADEARAGTASASRILLADILRPLSALRSPHTDKRTYGHLFVIGGSASYPGAILMTVQAALRSGVGLLTAFVPASLVPEYAARFPEVMWVGWPDVPGGVLTSAVNLLLAQRLERATAVLIGPGLGAAAETLAAVADIVRSVQQPVLLDADAIRPEILAAAAGRRLIITPHAGELKRVEPALPGSTASELVVVAKAPMTRVQQLTSPQSIAAVSYHSLFGGPVLARGGSGDILAGIIGGLLAQSPHELLLAAAQGVVWHGLAADILARDRGQVAVQTTQLLDYLQPALTHAANESS
jgi:ADP-dependent NAD(P)H-hydrate dehydratase / NAD(P)H-hydrate epimerase